MSLKNAIIKGTPYILQPCIKNETSHYLCGIVRKFNFQVLFEDKLSVAIIWSEELCAIVHLFLRGRKVVHFTNELIRQEEPNL